MPILTIALAPALAPTSADDEAGWPEIAGSWLGPSLSWPMGVGKHVAEDALIVEARPIVDFGAGAVPGSVSNTLRPVFGSWLGWLVEPEQPLIFVLNDDQDRDELVGHGERAMTVASLLTPNDYANVFVFKGGPDTWSEATGNRL